MIERLTAILNGASFHRGLALGALVGAAIAGSTIWNRLSSRRSMASGDESERVKDQSRRSPANP
jgi:hypothetical protein